MAERENIKERSRKLNPKTAGVSEIIDRALYKHGFTEVVTITEDMTSEEEELSVFESYLKEGFSPEEADKKSRASVKLMHKVFKY